MNPDHSKRLTVENRENEVSSLNKKGGSLSAMAAAMAIASVSLSACDKIKSVLSPRHETQYVTWHIDSTPSDPNRPDFLDQKQIELGDLDGLMVTKARFDNYIFNTVTGNRAFAQTIFINKGYKFTLKEKEYTFPYHALIFKPVDPKSNTTLPPRLGKTKGGQKLTDLFNNVTVYKGNNPKDIQAIKIILATSYEMSFGIKLDPNAIEVLSDKKERIIAIKYKASNAKEISVTTTVAKKREKNKEYNYSEIKFTSETKEEKHTIVDNDGNLQFPPSIVVDEGIAIPLNAIPKYKEIKYKKTFTSQGKRITIPINIPLESLKEDEENLKRQKRPAYIFQENGDIWGNPALYVQDDAYIKNLAELITQNFQTKKEKMQAITDFVHSYKYIPDEYGSPFKTAKMSLIAKGGDCEDVSILTTTLAEAVGINCVFTYWLNSKKNESHIAIGCDIDGPGTGFEFEGKKYEWVEATPSGEKIGERLSWAGKFLGISTLDSHKIIYVEETKKRKSLKLKKQKSELSD